MVLRDIAAMTGMDISTVSRATAGKWLATQFGVYPLKSFFNERVTDDSDVSSREIMSAIRDIIDTEDKTTLPATTPSLLCSRHAAIKSHGAQWQNTALGSAFRRPVSAALYDRHYLRKRKEGRSRVPLSPFITLCLLL